MCTFLEALFLSNADLKALQLPVSCSSDLMRHLQHLLICGECGKEVKRRVRAGWSGWRKVSGVMSDKRVSKRLKGKGVEGCGDSSHAVGLETRRKRREAELEVAERRMKRFTLGVTRM